MFSREPIRRPTSKARVRRAQRIALEEYRSIRAEAPKDFHSFISKEAMPNHSLTQYYPVFGVDENGHPRNIIGDTIVGLASRERMKAIRKGDTGTAIAAAIVEQVVVDSAKNHQRRAGDGRDWY